jgi:hypothetical protein
MSLKKQNVQDRISLGNSRQACIVWERSDLSVISDICSKFPDYVHFHKVFISCSSQFLFSYKAGCRYLVGQADFRDVKTFEKFDSSNPIYPS